MTPPTDPTAEAAAMLITFEFLCFDAVNRRHTDADTVEAMSPHHACQEYVAALEAGSNAVSREPYIIAVKPQFRGNAGWDLYKVSPTVTVEYPVSTLTPEVVQHVNQLQNRPVNKPLQLRPVEHRAPDGHAPSRDPADDALGLGGRPGLSFNPAFDIPPPPAVPDGDPSIYR